MKKLYLKIAPVMAKVSLVGLIVSLLAIFGINFYAGGLEETKVYAIFYAAWAKLIVTYLAVAFVVLYVVFGWLKLWPALKEMVRKTIVSLKRNPSTIPLMMMLVTFLFYSLNLTDVSDTTAKIYGKGMGLSAFCIMLFSLLSLVCMLNAFPRRKKPNIPMIVLMFAMFGIIIFCDIHYSNTILAAITRPENPIQITVDTKYIAEAYNMLKTHMVLTIVSAALVLLMPIYSKLLRKINTSVVIEDNGEMGQIDIQD